MATDRRRLAAAPLRASLKREAKRPVTKPEIRAAAPAKPEFRAVAQTHALEALEALAWLAQNASSEAARVSAANAVIDRAHGRPAPGAKAASEDEGEGGGTCLEVRWLDPAKS